MEMGVVRLTVLSEQHLRKNKQNVCVKSIFVQICIQKGKISKMGRAVGVRRRMASICDRSFDLISILGKGDFASNSYIGIRVVFFKNRCFH